MWTVISPLFPAVKATGRPPDDRRTVVEATAWRARTGAQGEVPPVVGVSQDKAAAVGRISGLCRLELDCGNRTQTAADATTVAKKPAQRHVASLRNRARPSLPFRSGLPR
ncbi:transposase [Dietzia sp. PP-33]|uniref:transposase n=1 Tax=Dietzia sp. PP-33 TaxID=2957500 RepID=UPI0039B09D7F